MHHLHFLTQLLRDPTPANLAALAGLVVLGLAACYLASRINVTVMAVTGLVLQLFSGNWKLMGIPLPLDRLVLLLALAALILKGPRWVSTRRIVIRPLHLAMLSAAAWALSSAIIVGTISTKLGFYALLDRFGFVPFLLFFLCPLLFDTDRKRHILLGAMVGIGFYLGLTGIQEGAHIYKFVFPRYIADPFVGMHWHRARGPFLESTGDGFCIFVGGVAGALGLRTWKTSWVRAICIATIVLDGISVFFTLTRSVWIGAFLGTVVPLLLIRKTRRVVVPALLIGALAVGGSLAVSSKLRSEVLTRVNAQSPVWDRENTDLATLQAVKEHPLTGVGWENFIHVSGQYMRQQPGYPITGLDIEAHNVFLSHLAELGIPGLLLWLLGFGGAVLRALSPKWPRAPGESAELSAAIAAGNPWRRTWQYGGLAVVLCFLVIGDAAPFSEALPNSLLWIWLGVLAIPYTSRLRWRRAVVPMRAPEARQAQALEPVGA